MHFLISILDVHDKCAVSSYSEQQILDMKQANGNQEVLLKEGSSNIQGALSDEKFIFSSVGLVESIESQVLSFYLLIPIESKVISIRLSLHLFIVCF